MARVLTLILLCFLMPLLHAQSLRMEQISIKEGLSQSYVPCILQDQEGFVWIGTKNGLNRYDGHDFQIFTRDPEDPFSMSDDQIWAMSQTGDFLLIANGAGILDFYHKQTRRFFHLPLSAEKATKTSYTQKIFLDSKRNIWLLTGLFEESIHLCFIAVPEGFWERLVDEPELVKALKPHFIASSKSCSAEISKDLEKVYFNTRDSFFVVDTKTLKQTLVYCPKTSESSNRRDHISQ